MSESLILGNIVEGKVIKIKPFGAIISLEGNHHGLVHISHISKDFVQNVDDYLALGDSIKVKIISIDDEKTKISLSLKDVDDKISGVRKPVKNATAEKTGDGEKTFRKKTYTDNRPVSTVSKKDTYFTTKPKESPKNFEDIMKDYVKSSNEKLATINKRNKKK